MPNWSRQTYNDLLRRRAGDATRSHHPVPSAVELSCAPSTDVSKLNKTEHAFYNLLLQAQGHQWIGVQNITLKLADDCRLTPDFSYIDPNGHFVFVDVKGFQREDALIKMKVAARQFPMFRFVIVKRGKNEWIYTEVKP